MSIFLATDAWIRIHLDHWDVQKVIFFSYAGKFYYLKKEGKVFKRDMCKFYFG